MATRKGLCEAVKEWLKREGYEVHGDVDIDTELRAHRFYARIVKLQPKK